MDNFTIKFILFFFLFCFPINIILPQWSTDPNNNLIIGYGLNPELCSDSAGGCYVTYESGGPNEISLRRIDKYGYEPWGYKKIIYGELEEQEAAKIIEDGECGVIVSYGDHILHNSFRLRLQKVDSNGNFLWGPAGVRVNVTDTRQSVQRLVTDGDGGCVIVWIDTLAKYKINRINRFGQRVWSDSGKVIGVDEYYGKPQLVRASDGYYYVNIRESIYKINANGEIIRKDSVMWGYITPDPEGGIVLSGRVWTGMIPKLVAQRKDSLGNNLWQEPYVEIADSLDINTLFNVKYNNGYFYYGWTGKKNGIDKVAQFQTLRLDGTRLFPDGSLPLSNYPIDAGLGGILPSDPGTVVFVWVDFRPDDGVFAQKVDTSGNKLWDTSDVRLCAGAYADLYTTTDGGGGAIGLGCHQYDFSLRIFKISMNGIMGEVITEIKDFSDQPIFREYFLYHNFPNPFNSSTIIKYQMPQEWMVKINLYNILGEKIKTLFEGEQVRSVHQLVLSSNELSSGVYFYTLETGSFVISKKLTILK